MAPFNRNRGEGGGRRDFRDKDRNRPIMHQAICSSCGKSCEVPFRPTGDKPVYCRDCFAGRAAMGGDRSRRPDPRSFRGRENNNFPRRPEPTPYPHNENGNGNIKKELENINKKLERLIVSVEALARQTSYTEERPKTTKKESPKDIYKKTITAKIAAKIAAKKGSKKK